MNPINQLFASLPNANLPARHANEYVEFTQNETFFHLQVAKDARLAALRAHFARTGMRKLFLSANLSGFDCAIDGIDVEILEKNFFQEDDEVRRAAKKALIEGGVVILNNNDAGTPEARHAYADFFGDCTTTCFIAWDWDNHHWLELSSFLAAHSDIYAPAHHENLYLLSRYNWAIAGPVYCSSVQWPRKQLTEQLADMLTAERSSAPLGMHIPYGQFNFRIRVVSTLHQHYPSIGFSDRTFHVRTPEDRLKEWYSHKTHWIIPVLNDVPIRIFDALVTGGIPIVPASLAFLPPIRAIPRQHIVFYSASDIVDPARVVARANALFDEGGRDAMVARHRYALENHHGDFSVKQMLDYAAELMQGC